MEHLEDRRVYRIRSRNLVVGAWRAETQGFIGIREKFGSLYLFEEYHYDTGPPTGTAREVEALDIVVPEGVPLAEHLDSRCSECEGLVEFVPDNPPRERWRHLDGTGDHQPRAYLPENQALFDLLRPYDEAINAQLAEERQQAEIEAESKRMAPQTREEFERERRVAKVEEWWKSIPREDKLDGRKPLWNEYQRRLDAAIKGESE